MRPSQGREGGSIPLSRSHPLKLSMNKNMNSFKFSPIKNKKELFEAIKHVHFQCHKLCKRTFGYYLPNAGNVGIFCHYDDEFDRLTKLRKEMTILSDNWQQKYFRLHEPIVIPAYGDIPKTIYTYLYIRKPDPNHPDVGDVDFYLKPEKYKELKESLLSGKKIAGANILERPNFNWVKLTDPDIDASAFVGTYKMSEVVKTKRSEG